MTLPPEGQAPAGAALLDLVAVMDRLRVECAWTAEQTHESLARYVLEETHEVLEALDSGDREALRDELGDLLMQVVFHARIAQESVRGFDVDDVARGIADKLRRRNPHVFGDGTARTPEEIDAAWQAVKAQEKAQEKARKSAGGGGAASVHDGIPATLPALAYADKVLKRLGDPGVPESDDIGTRLLALVAEARVQGVDPEEALRRTVRSLPDTPA